MGSLYIMEYAGNTGVGGGVLYIGNGTLLGADVGQIIYRGSYTENGGQVIGKATMKGSSGLPSPLVTGDMLPAGTEIPIEFNLPSSFADGRSPHTISIAGRTVKVIFKKIGDVP